MSEQNFSNHVRLHRVWHFVIPSLALVILIMSIINLVHSGMHGHDLHMWLPIILIPIVMLLIWGYSRSFALKVQDRAIRAEENFRHYILTGKPLDRQLRLGQIIALRFASDEEFPALAQKAVAEKMAPKAIKAAVQHWKADHNRV